MINELPATLTRYVARKLAELHLLFGVTAQSQKEEVIDVTGFPLTLLSGK